MQILVRPLNISNEALKNTSLQGDVNKMAHAEKKGLVKFKFSVR